MTPVPELAQQLGIPPGTGAKLLRAAYGLVSAPKEWFGEVDQVIRDQCQMRRLLTDPCVWILQDVVRGQPMTVGYIAAHVDDFLISGDPHNAKWLEVVEVFRRAFVWSPWENTPFTHCGVGVTQGPDFGFELQHHGFCEEIKQIDIDMNSSQVSSEELSQARAVLGGIQWRALQTGPQHMAKLSPLQSSLARADKEVLQQVNKLCREVYAARYVSVGVKQLSAETDDDLSFACWTDAAVGNRPDLGSTGGYVVGMIF